MKSGERAARVLIVADLRLHRDGLATVLASQPGIDVAATAEGAEALAVAEASDPDVIVMDMSDPMSASRLGTISARLPGRRPLAFALLEAVQDLLATAEPGAIDEVAHQASPVELADVVRRAAGGNLVSSPRIGVVLSHRAETTAAPARRGAGGELTPRELEVSVLIARGLSNKEIADRLCIEVATVKNHVHRILTKMQARHRGEAAARIREGALS